MSNTEDPAGDTGGESSTPAHTAPVTLPERVRVHALARLIGKTSRQVLDALSRIGEPARSAQSSVARDVALRVVEEHDQQGATQPDAAQPAEPDAAPEEATAAGRARPAIFTPVFTAPSATFLPPKQQDAEEATETEPAEDAAQQDDEDGESGRRRRRRGRRGRGRGKGGPGDDAESDEQDDRSDEETDTAKRDKSGKDKSGKDTSEKDTGEKDRQDAESGDGDAAQDDDAQGDGGSRRRRRRRRRKSGSDDDSSESNDPPGTVTHVREGRNESSDTGADQVRSVRGSTRLEAKRQRRRDGRDQGRRRVPILSESEFLARRESVDRKMVVREHGDQVQIGVLEDDVLVEHFVTSSGSGSLVGNVYLGRVQNVLPSMEAAFVDIGRGRNAVLYAGEVDWDSAGLEGKARKIEQALSTGDSVLVQVTKDPVGHKGARLTTQISLPGRFLVYVPAGGATGISRKLPDTERKRLKDVLKKVVPSDAGVIVRTASEGVSEDELGRDVSRLQSQWEVIRERSQQKSAKAPQLLYEEPDLLIKVVRDMFTEDFSALTVSGGDAWSTINSYVQHVAPDLADRLKRHTGKNDVFTEFRIDEQITKAMDRKVWLPSGGYLIVDRTEAMTVIDVNTGKFTGSGGNLEETVTRNNLESAEEIVRQLRLRDIGGIIVIDFIDMVLESNRELVLRRLTECLGRDRTRHQVAEVTSLGLVQMTRKRVGTGLLEAFSTPCEHCRGRGVLVSTEPVSAGNAQGSRKKRGRGGEDKNSGAQQQAGHSDQENRKAVAAVAAATLGDKPDEAKDSDTGDDPQDSGRQDSGRQDSGKQDSGKQDSGKQDSGKQDSGKQDSGKQSRGAARRERAAQRAKAAEDSAEGASATEPGATEPDATEQDDTVREDTGTDTVAESGAPAEQVVSEEPGRPETPPVGEEWSPAVDSNGSAPFAGQVEQSDQEDAGQEPVANGQVQDTGASGSRRRRRGASRPAGPPESTPV